MPYYVLLTILTVFPITFFLGYIIEKRSRRAGVVFVIAGLFLGMVVTINYFVEVPFLIFAACFSGYIGAFFFSAFEVARKEAGKET